MKERFDPEKSVTPPERVRSWRLVYLLVLGCFLLYLILMTAFTRAFS